MTLRWRQDMIGSGSRLYRVAGLGPSDVEVSCVCVCVCVRERHKFVYDRIMRHANM
jgi:hypothetical protein